MKVHVRIATDDDREVDLTIDHDGDVTVADLVAALDERLATRRAGGRHTASESIGQERPLIVDGRGRVDADTPLSQLDLRHGDRLRFGDRHTAGPSAHFTVVDGPHMGRTLHLGNGHHVIGRDVTVADVVLGDESISRRHASVLVARSGVTVADAGSTNGTIVDGTDATEALPLPCGGTVTIGTTRLLLERLADRATRRTDRPRAHDGWLTFNRPPRVRTTPTARTHQLPAPPESPRPQRVPVAAALVPVVLGALAYLVLREPSTLLFLTLGPLMVILSVVDGRRSGRSEFRRARQRWLDQLADVLAAADANRAEISDATSRSALAPAEVLRAAINRSTTVWERRPTDDDFLALRLGTGDRPGSVTITPPAGGDTTLVRTAHEAIVARAIDHDAPAVINLADCGVLGLAGPAPERVGIARSLLVQIAALHSPRDVTLAAALAGDLPSWDWLLWLPHVSPLDPSGSAANTASSTGVAAGGAAGALVTEVADLVAQRRAQRRNDDQPWRRIVLIADHRAMADPRHLHLIATHGPSVGVYTVALADHADALPGECGAIVDLVESSLTDTRSGTVSRLDMIDLVTTAESRAVAVSLSPLLDVGTESPSARIPTTSLLLDLLDLTPPHPSAIERLWSRPSATAAGAPVGAGADGDVSIDLERDGPHMVVAGTTGSGKSELLQSLIASCAATNGPDRLNFVLIDYKGGAAFKDLVHLPHTVGFVTDLDGHLARRALASLEAELKHRERLLAAEQAKDVAELWARRPSAAPPRFVIVFDEFAALRSDVPEFVEGVIDIAQRGRSLGVHLVLATQSPSGIVDDKIRANTNIWIALRTRGEQESRDILGSAHTEAAAIGTAQKGRGYLRIGNDPPVPFQSAYVGERRATVRRERRIEVSLLTLTPHATTVIARPALPVDDTGATDLQRLVAAMQLAHRGPAPRRPWLAPLPAVVTLDAIGTRAAAAADADAGTHRGIPHGTARHRRHSGGLAVTLGLIDVPHEQRQVPWVLDLDETGHVLVVGSSGSGKTTVLRSLAVALATTMPTTHLWMYALDFASRGLTGLEHLPHVGSVIPGDDRERVERLLTMLEDEVTQRRHLLADAGADSIAELRGSARPCPPAIVVLIDGYAGLDTVDDALDRGRTVERVAALLGEGRPLGLHIVITASRRSGLSTQVTSQITTQLALHLAEPEEYAWMDLAAHAKGMTFPPGRCLIRGAGTECQLAVVAAAEPHPVDAGGPPAEDRAPGATGTDQHDAIVAIAAGLDGDPNSMPPPIRRLPAFVTWHTIAASGRSGTPIGLDAMRLAPIGPDVDSGPTWLVLGPSGAGRSTALAVTARSVLHHHPQLEAILIAPRSTSIDVTLPWTDVHRGVNAAVDALTTLAAGLAGTIAPEVATDRRSPARLIVVDDADELDEGAATMALEQLARRARDSGQILLVSAQAYSAHRAFGGWLGLMKKNGHGLLLWPDLDVDGDLLGAPLPRRGERDLPPGRGYLVSRGRSRLIQVAHWHDENRTRS